MSENCCSDRGVYVDVPESDILDNENVTPLPLGQVENVLVAAESGPCFGVDRTLDTLEKLYEKDPSRAIQVNRKPTNGADSNAYFDEKGFKFDVSPEDADSTGIYVISAHGHPETLRKAKDRGLETVDSTCPRVLQTHDSVYGVNEVLNSEKRVSQYLASTAILYLSLGGNGKHAEFIGTKSLVDSLEIPFYAVNDAELSTEVLRSAIDDGIRRFAIVSQTTNDAQTVGEIVGTLSKEAQQISKAKGVEIDFDKSFPYSGKDVCRTVTHRQDAVRKMVACHSIDTLVVVGSVQSNNTRVLADVAQDEAQKMKTKGLEPALQRVILVNSHDQVPDDVVGNIGVVSGASTLQRNVFNVIKKLSLLQSPIIIGGCDNERPVSDFWVPQIN